MTSATVTALLWDLDRKCMWMPEAALVLLSGGMDSATVLGILDRSKRTHRIDTVTFNYGQRHFEVEDRCAAMIADHYNCPHNTIDLTGIVPPLFTKSPLIKASGEAVPTNESPNRGTVAPTYVPRRNTVLLALAAAVAEQREIDSITYGAHATDSAYPDCTSEFVDTFSELLYVGSPSGNVLGLFAPIIGLTKAQVVELAIEVRVPLELTHSCYQGMRPACGVCDTCQIRIEAFKEAGYQDPIEYEIPIDWGNLQVPEYLQ
jgi:7-cyano-7-deazaguanine synthase